MVTVRSPPTEGWLPLIIIYDYSRLRPVSCSISTVYNVLSLKHLYSEVDQQHKFLGYKAHCKAQKKRTNTQIDGCHLPMWVTGDKCSDLSALPSSVCYCPSFSWLSHFNTITLAIAWISLLPMIVPNSYLLLPQSYLWILQNSVPNIQPPKN